MEGINKSRFKEIIGAYVADFMIDYDEKDQEIGSIARHYNRIEERLKLKADCERGGDESKAF